LGRIETNCIAAAANCDAVAHYVKESAELALDVPVVSDLAGLKKHSPVQCTIRAFSLRIMVRAIMICPDMIIFC
jgi:hypothetical protein